MVRPYVVDGARADEPVDLRVSAVLEVLGGRPVPAVASEQNVDPAVLHRWVRAFVAAGAAQVTNQPTSDIAQQRDRFLAAFAHEVRTPLSVAVGWVSLLLDGEVPPTQARRTLLRLHKALDRLSERTLDVELMTTASLGRLALSPSLVRIESLVAGLDGAPQISGRADVEVVVDPTLFRRVLRDLWEAAATAPAPRRRWLEVRRVSPWIEVRVGREGHPIAPEVLQAMFDPFDVNDDRTGVTLGLYLVRALAVAHGGTVGVEQRDDVAEFWVRIPDRTSTEEDR